MSTGGAPRAPGHSLAAQVVERLSEGGKEEKREKETEEGTKRREERKKRERRKEMATHSSTLAREIP